MPETPDPPPAMSLQYASPRDVNFKSAKPLGTATTSVLVLLCLALVVYTESLLGALQLMEDMASPGATSASRDMLEYQVWKTGVLSKIVWAIRVVAWVLFLMWTHRAYLNLWAISSQAPRFRVGTVVASFFMPGINLFRPCQAMLEIHRGSDSHGRGGSRIVLWWWSSYLAAMGVTCTVLAAMRLGMLGGSVIRWLSVTVGGYVLEIVAAVLAITMISRINRLQALAISHIDNGPPPDLNPAERIKEMLEHPETAAEEEVSEEDDLIEENAERGTRNEI